MKPAINGKIHVVKYKIRRLPSNNRKQKRITEPNNKKIDQTENHGIFVSKF